jgi:hypothetical protein
MRLSLLLVLLAALVAACLPGAHAQVLEPDVDPLVEELRRDRPRPTYTEVRHDATATPPRMPGPRMPPSGGYRASATHEGGNMVVDQQQQPAQQPGDVRYPAVPGYVRIGAREENERFRASQERRQAHATEQIPARRSHVLFFVVMACILALTSGLLLKGFHSFYAKYGGVLTGKVERPDTLDEYDRNTQDLLHDYDDETYDRL